MIDTSLIITLYQGNQYLPYLLQIAEENFKRMKMQMGLDCELILVNDEPGIELPVQEGKNSWGEIIVCSSKVNCGIHGARKLGVKKARGQYLIFLDQDDKISVNYLVSQRKEIGDWDAVVCNGYLTRYCMAVKWNIYAFPEAHSRVADLEKYLSQGNQIISPGQVLLKKEAIPGPWLDRTMTHNGADDYLLWVFMLFSGKKFGVNPEFLYVHVGHGGNLSNQTAAMDESIKEAIGIMQESAELLGIQNIHLDKIDQWRVQKREMESSGKLAHIVKLHECWTYLETKGILFSDFFQEQGIERLVIYGLGYIGGRLFEQLKDQGVDVVCGIDQQADRVVAEGIPVVLLDGEELKEYMRQSDAIVVTAVFAFPEISRMLEERYQGYKIFSFDEIMQELLARVEDSGKPCMPLL